MILGVACLRHRADGRLAEPRGLDLLPARRPRLRPAGDDRRDLLRPRQGRRGPDEHAQPRLLGHDPAVRRGPGDHDQRDDADQRRRPAIGGLPTWVYFFAAGIVGLATSVAFVYITQYYTAGSYRPVREIAEASKTGPATNIISGHRRRLRDDRRDRDHDRHRPVRQLLARHAGQPAVSATGVNVGGIFGTAVATMGMLMTTAYILAMDTFGPITDNAGGIAEFSRAEEGAREITDRLDAVGNTTKALTKGYAIASASLAAFLLFSAYIDKINLIQGRRIAAGVPGAELLNSVNLANVNVFIAALLAAMLVYFFSSLAIRAVGTTAQTIIVEVRRQFREMPGIMDYTQRPDYARVVDITTRRRAPPDDRCRASSRSPRRSSSASSSASRRSPAC